MSKSRENPACEKFRLQRELGGEINWMKLHAITVYGILNALADGGRKCFCPGRSAQPDESFLWCLIIQVDSLAWGFTNSRNPHATTYCTLLTLILIIAVINELEGLSRGIKPLTSSGIVVAATLSHQLTASQRVGNRNDPKHAAFVAKASQDALTFLKSKNPAVK